MSAPAVAEASPPPSASFWKRRIVAPIVGQLRQGITPEKIALTLALGAVLSIFPILGATTILCTLTAFALRLNQPVIQLTNYLAYPAQLALLIPFYRAGETLFGKQHVPLSIQFLLESFRADPAHFLREFGIIGLQGIAVWALVAPVLVAVLCFALRPPLRALARRSASA